MSADALAALLADARAAVAFTGAGTSTESGIPDFRSPGGLWSRYDPRDFTFARYVRSAEIRVLERALELVASADLVLVIGSSAQVQRAADVPASAARAGVPLAILNDEPTPLDAMADLVVRGRAAKVLPAAVHAALAPT